VHLPDDSIGITDIISYRECPRRFSYGMKRHVGPGEQDPTMIGEAQIRGAAWARAYGSAIHDAIHRVEEGDSDEQAVQFAFNRWGRGLEPSDLALLHQDLEVYRSRDFPGTRIVASEEDARVPLMLYRGRQVYFRFKLDRLYERLDRPGSFIHVDYKSSRHAKSEKEVREDLQMWAYNWAIHEFWPECDDLVQIYEQLRYGQIPTRKTAAARAKIKEWLIAQTTAIIEDENFQPDGLLPFQQNEWCEWCPIMESCGVIDQLTEFSLVEIAALAPVEKQGRRKVTRLDSAPVEEYVERLAQVKSAVGVLKRYDDAVSSLLKEMPAERRGLLGYELRERSTTKFPPEALRAMHDALGDRFYEVAGVTKTAIEQRVDDDDLQRLLLELGREEPGSSVLLPIHRG
jgi:ketosteroid isomerase-like protein